MTFFKKNKQPISSTLFIKVIVLAATFLFCLTSSDHLIAKGVASEKPITIEFLTKKKWVLAEIVNTKNDTATNLTVFLLPCEKDNFTQYQQEGTYNIFDGQTKCSGQSDEILGKGTWEFDPSDKSLLIETYQGGREIEKKILELSDNTFQLEFESEGNAVTRLTYFSSEALQSNDEEILDRIEDPSNHTQTLSTIVREMLIEKGGFVIVSETN